MDFIQLRNRKGFDYTLYGEDVPPLHCISLTINRGLNVARKQENRSNVTPERLDTNSLASTNKGYGETSCSFWREYRIIDFLSPNCANSGVSTVGVLTQFMPLELNFLHRMGTLGTWSRVNGGLTILPPYTAQTEWYKGTANAIYQKY